MQIKLVRSDRSAMQKEKWPPFPFKADIVWRRSSRNVKGLKDEEPEGEEEDDLFRKLKYLLVVGRLLGILPFSGTFKKSYTSLKFSIPSRATLVSVLIFLVLLFNLALGVYDTFKQSKTSAYEIAQSLRGTIQFIWSCIIYLYFLRRGRSFLNLFDTWAHTRLVYTSPDTHLKRDVALITTFVLLSAIGENAVLHLEYVKALDSYSGYRFGKGWDLPFLVVYYYRAQGHWAHFPYLPYHDFIAVISFIQHKFMLYSCNYMDIMITVFARALYFKFERLYELARERLQVNGGRGCRHRFGARGGSILISKPITGQEDWLHLVEDHTKLCEILQEFENFFSPLIFGSYMINVFYICMQLLDGITNVTADSIIHSIYAPWSFIHVILRILLVSISSARINSYAHKIRDVIQDCPTEFYCSDVARLDQKVVVGRPIGLSGLGAFTITKPFILNIISVVFTFEIVLLQGIPAPNANNSNASNNNCSPTP